MEDDPTLPIKPTIYNAHFAEPDNLGLLAPPKPGRSSAWAVSAGSLHSGDSGVCTDNLETPGAASARASRISRRHEPQTEVKGYPSTGSRSSRDGKHKVRWYHICAQRIVSNNCFVALTMVLTVYALTGDDVRLLATNKPADFIFNIMTLVCLVCFSFEIVVSCLGKDDYFGGFFFGLDAVSTASLVLDLTWIADLIIGDEDDFDKARSGRTARLGAKVGRIVRVIRLVRIVKLYKAWYDARKKREKRRQSRMQTERGLEDDDDSDFEEDEEDHQKNLTQHQHHRESLVGKKLSALTTQRVIILVLTMLLVLPLLRAEPLQQTPRSPTYGADDVWEAFHSYTSGKMPRLFYERTLLKYIYYHNWFTGNYGCTGDENKGCSNLYYSNVFWIGIVGQDMALLERTAPLAHLRSTTVAAWEANVSRQDDAYNYGTMPAQAQVILSNAWRDDECKVSNLAHMGISLLTDEINDYNSFSVKCPSDVRIMEKAKWSPRVLTVDAYKSWHFAFYFDLRPKVKAESAFSLATTAFVCVVLCVASVFFSKDANSLVLEPVEKMITKVNTIRENPLIAMKMADDEFRLEEMKKITEARANKEVFMQMLKSYVLCKSAHHGELMETVILDKTIIKLGTLLALGFGEAGASIFSHSMGNHSNMGMDAMGSGSRVDCILGLVRIRDFSVATEVLQGKVMTFVNQVAEIVHGIVDEFAGAANKNNGETFMLVWRTEGYSDEKAAKTADMSLVAFARVLGAVHRSRTLAVYRGHPALKQRLRNGWRVNLTIGLHLGWAIEGAVGSEFKIDASYLSPNVSIAASVEHAASIYDVSICATESVVAMCTKEMAKQLRMIDRVIITGSSQPLELYSLDLDCLSLQVDEAKPRCFIWNLRQRYKARQMLEAEKNRKWMPDFSIRQLFDESPDVTIMRQAYNEEFLETFNMGYQNYAEGEWSVARTFLSITQDLLGFRDGPSVALLRFMDSHRFEAPDNWQGFHRFCENVDILMDEQGVRLIRPGRTDSKHVVDQPIRFDSKNSAQSSRAKTE